MIRMHLNENPLVKQRYCRYPDPQYGELRSLLRKQFGLKHTEVLIGNGSTEIITAIFLWAHLNQKKIVFPWPSYILYQELEYLFKTDVTRISFGLDEWDIEKIADAVPENGLLILCNPNNPTGRYLPREAIRRLISKLPVSATVLLDEAYIEYVDVENEEHGLTDADFIQKCIVVRTFSKFYGLAGWRIGYALLSSDLFKTLRPYLQLWNVSAPALEIATSCVLDQKRFLEGKQKTLHLRDYLSGVLKKTGFSVLPSQTNFLCFTHPNIDMWIETWKNEGYLINLLLPFVDSELNSYVRLSIEEDDIMEKFLQCILKER
ncbi:histidinol-phosphate aminotransferase family protein [Paenibacillus polymyxa]|uniref:pyridoxal phosphate-dependent aminotransferase n=1 Tax=Paenibacillus polymyxa TaxID=1406 RepID=UPI001BEAF1FF|nr:histidinol-phosphate transaminase [Paenibacillus polymyxa]MBT2284122.1 histidinol-phosphate aminotransferase family protein [Paenibacillus polymyxa]